MAGLSEFELIKRYFSSISYLDNDSVLLGVGDDCGIVSPPPGSSLCFSLDTLVEGIHFPKNAPPFDLAYRSLAAAMSDLAAMGAKPFSKRLWRIVSGLCWRSPVHLNPLLRLLAVLPPLQDASWWPVVILRSPAMRLVLPPQVFILGCFVLRQWWP